MDFYEMSEQQKERWKKRGNRIGIIIGIVLLLLILGIASFQWIIDYIWMDHLGFKTVFTTILGSKIMLGVIGFLLFSILMYITLSWIRKSYVGHLSKEQLPAFITKKKQSIPAMLGISALVGLVGSSIIQGIGWEPLLKLLNHATFGETDPYFNMDISFYVFILPFIKFIVYVLLGLAIFFVAIEIAAYSVFHMYRMSRSAQLHMGVTLSFIGILLAGLHVLAPYETLLSNNVNIFQNSVVHGLSYTDDLVNIPAAYILAGAAIIGTIWMIISLARGKITAMAVPVIAYVVLLIAAQGVSVAVQQFVVSPNEFSRESPYLQHNLDYTRAAYDLENISEEEHPATPSLDADMIERNELTINNVRINDARPLLDIYNQLQTFRTYYQFNDIDVDRYEIDGEYQQVFVGARELSTQDLPEQAHTWVNRTLRYTHGYGVAMSHVNELTAQGQPQYMLSNLPPQGDMDISRPQIYFGEQNDYENVIVNTEVDEFDYPSGEENMSTRYEEEEGIPMTFMNRLLFAINEGSFRMLVSDQVSSESLLLETRNIMDRVQRIAPFFEYDSDPYIFVRDDGSLAWMMDAYLTAERYPYAEAYQGQESYIRNSVKVVVDAYTGAVNFYPVETEDPLLQTYQNIFPDLFTAEIPEDVQAHFRYPERLFKIQATMYGTYHMTNLEVFYNREDNWEFPTERYFNEDIEMEPYYVTMSLPGYEEEEFILMTPYSPRNRQNMVAWMGVRNDGENYGEMFVHRFPQQRNVYGPQQIENRINQDSRISQELNLWSQGGSEVIRGNLLTIPIEDTIMYVEPVYIESSNQTSLPEVQQIIVAYEDEIVMAETFDEALEQILSLVDPDFETDVEVPEEPVDPDEEMEDPADQEDPLQGADEVLSELSELFDAYQDALSDGDWEEAGSIMAEIEAYLNN
ncbi:UPF0182 family protein [Virgibacillus sp. YIM 98842]|uniref:UPF0182 family membrane protein n=1 Tax=Virgibacillus sp. YIM 98842 TaxID=2663533 RepID=UPI0032048A34